MPQPAADIRRTAFRRATELVAALHLPPGTALAATGSYARRELTAYSDLDLLLICPPDQALDSAVKHQVENLWYPIWDAKIRLDYAVRTPEECANIIADNAVAGLSLLDLTHVAGDPSLTEQTRKLVLRTWRIALSRNFDGIIDTAIARWRRSGPVVSMTHPDLKHGRGGSSA